MPTWVSLTKHLMMSLKHPVRLALVACNVEACIACSIERGTFTNPNTPDLGAECDIPEHWPHNVRLYRDLAAETCQAAQNLEMQFLL